MRLLVRTSISVMIFAWVLGIASYSGAQQIYQEAGNQGSMDSFSESGSVSGMFQGPHGFFRFGDHSPPLTPLGQHDLLGGGLSGGLGFVGGDVSGNLNFNFSQSSTRSMTSASAGVTSMDGVPGSIQSQTSGTKSTQWLERT